MANKPKTLTDKDNTDPIVFDFEGVEYTLPHPKRWPIDAIEAQEEGKGIAFLKHFLGEDQWKTFKESGDEPRTQEDVENLMEKYADIVDTTLGK